MGALGSREPWLTREDAGELIEVLGDQLAFGDSLGERDVGHVRSAERNHAAPAACFGQVRRRYSEACGQDTEQ